MYIPAPAVIQQINLLELNCGFKLSARTNHGVTLAPAGQSLYQGAGASSRCRRTRCKRHGAVHGARLLKAPVPR